MALPERAETLRPGGDRRRLGGRRQRAGRGRHAAASSCCAATTAPPGRWRSPPGRRGSERRGPVFLVDGGRLAGLAWLEGDDDRSLSVRASLWNGTALAGPRARLLPGTREPARARPAPCSPTAPGCSPGAPSTARTTRSSGPAARADAWQPVQRLSAQQLGARHHPRPRRHRGRRRPDRLEPLRRHTATRCGWPASSAATTLDATSTPPARSARSTPPSSARSRLLYLDAAAPRSWSVLDLDAEGRVKAKASVASTAGAPGGRLRGEPGADALAGREAAGLGARWRKSSRETPPRRLRRSPAGRLSRRSPRRRPPRRPTWRSATASPSGVGDDPARASPGYPPRLQTLLVNAGRQRHGHELRHPRREDPGRARPHRHGPRHRASRATCCILMEGTNDINRVDLPRDHDLQPRHHGRQGARRTAQRDPRHGHPPPAGRQDRSPTTC